MPPRHFKRPALVDSGENHASIAPHSGDRLSSDEWLYLITNLPRSLARETLESVLREVSQEIGVLEFGEAYAVVKVVSRRAANAVADSLSGRYLGEGCYIAVSPTNRESLGIAHQKNVEAVEKLNFGSADVPSDIHLVRRIHATIERVRQYGPRFEMALMSEQRLNAEFAFLFPRSGAAHAYYRWLMYMLNDDSYVPELGPLSTVAARPRPIEIVWQGKKIVIAPPARFPPGLQDELDRLRNEKATSNNQPVLGETLRRHLDLLLHHATVRRGSIARITAFAHQFDLCAAEIVDVILASVCSALSPPNRTLIISRLWAIGDILANSGVCHLYRRELLHNHRLNTIFEQVRDAADSMPRITGERLRHQVIVLLSSWLRNTQIVFTNSDLVAVRELMRRFASYDGEEFTASDHEYYDNLISA
ncbi:hypothetical protein TRVA0_017S00144 [Trichomonascus vanleenenianus]|uniref:SWAP/Surp domain-containing protein n=1 Tax=Trichomonascus vanleenenianus TaxID=2268995 RepID=UPI003ECB1C9C